MLVISLLQNLREKKKTKDSEEPWLLSAGVYRTIRCRSRCSNQWPIDNSNARERKHWEFDEHSSVEHKYPTSYARNVPTAAARNLSTVPSITATYCIIIISMYPNYLQANQTESRPVFGVHESILHLCLCLGRENKYSPAASCMWTPSALTVRNEIMKAEDLLINTPRSDHSAVNWSFGKSSIVYRG